MEDQRIVFKQPDGSVGIIIPTLEWLASGRTMAELAEKDVPKGLAWRIVDVSALPASRNWRNAWTDNLPTATVDVDLEAAKQAHKQLMVAMAINRVDMWDQPQALAEIAVLPVNEVLSLQELYNLWPARIEKRNGSRTYQMHAN